ncbi:hypothetical protein ACWD5R_38170 [Streptomyces sp. NPDC002514]
MSPAVPEPGEVVSRDRAPFFAKDAGNQRLREIAAEALKEV